MGACCFAFLPMQCVQVKQQQAAPFHTWMCRAHRLTEGRSHKDRLCCCHIWICSASEEIDFNSGHYVYQVCANISMKVSVFLILAIVWETGEHVKKTFVSNRPQKEISRSWTFRSLKIVIAKFGLCCPLIKRSFSIDISVCSFKTGLEPGLICYQCVGTHPGCGLYDFDWRWYWGKVCPRSDDRCVKVSSILQPFLRQSSVTAINRLVPNIWTRL